jgi:hypothetical protein
MNRFAKILGVVITFVPVLVLGSCAYAVARNEKAFSETVDDDKRSTVVARFGSPDIEETAATPYLRYASSGCKAPCEVRLWWEHPVLPGIEAWSVEFDGQGKVVHTAHWVSP